MTTAAARVLIADDEESLRWVLEKGLRQAGYDVTAVPDGDSALRAFAEAPFDLVFLDIRMPGTDGIEATQRLTAGEDPPKVLILTTFDLDEYVVGALRAGASGFLAKDVPAEDLVTAIRTVAAGEAVVAPRILKRLLDTFAAVLPDPSAQPPRGLEALTDREREVLVQLARGLSNAEIARELSVSETTVKTHVGHVLTKLGLRDRVQAVVLAYETGLVRPGR